MSVHEGVLNTRYSYLREKTILFSSMSVHITLQAALASCHRQLEWIISYYLHSSRVSKELASSPCNWTSSAKTPTEEDSPTDI